MCGIMGCIGDGAVQKVYKGLVRLEYRGYDSAGISALAHGSICTIKQAGMVSRLESRLSGLKGEAAIGHTRWATHGKPSDVNAHPHAAGRFSVVHNGIIENYAELKAELVAEGAVFKSQTDSEVIVHLLNKYYSCSFAQAVKSTVARLKGAFALCILCSESQNIAVVRYKNPIIIGRGKGCFIASSDMPALAGEADGAYILKDGQMAFISRDGAKLYDFDLNEVSFAFTPVSVCAQSAELCGYPHFMIKEINEIPSAVENTLAAFGGVKDRLIGLYCGVERIILTGCGTACHSALTAACAMEEYLKIPAHAEVASELKSRNCAIDSNTLLIAVSQSGETADTVEAAQSAKERGARVVAVTNVRYCALNGCADVVVPVCAGAEVCVAATKSYCAQLAALLNIAQVLGGVKTEGLDGIARICEQVITGADVHALADACCRASGVYFIGRGADYPTALEGSLKLKEVSYIPGEGYPAGELKHGTLALIDGNTLTIALMTDPNLAGKTASSVEQIISRGGKVGVIVAEDCLTEGLERAVEVCVKIPATARYLSSIVAAIPLQLTAYYAAVKKGKNPDRPRNLAKSVTVE